VAAEVDVTYVTSRGQWYYASWKGDESKSGGIATNIGVHFFDMLSFVFGRLEYNVVHHRAIDCAAGYIEYEHARVRWFLSINGRDMTANEGFARRCMNVNGVGFFDFSKGFEELHTLSYEAILAGHGFPLIEVRPAIETVARIRMDKVELNKGKRHPALHNVLHDATRYANGWPV
jgi:UDP-N-acetyl-2-amino-2-deoxyglucuronate dehydrogenase